MKKLKLDSILLFILVVPFIMTYRLNWGDTPYWLFGIILFLLVINIALDLFYFRERSYLFIKRIMLTLVVVLVIGSAFVASIIVRRHTIPIYGVHDILLQQESAIRFLLHGKNPYSVTYFGTPLEQWNYSPQDINPALYHFVMEPFYVLFAIPFYLLTTRTIGFFDGRIPLLFLYAVSLIAAFALPKEEEKKRIFTILIAFNPAMLPYTLEGRSDMFMFGFFMLFLLFLERKWLTWSSIFLALAFAVKQSIWFIFPFYAYFIYLQTKSVTKFFKMLAPFALTFTAITLPFFLWDSKAFIESTISYLSGTALHSYPISGYGFGKLLNSVGVIKDVHMYYPFYLWQVVLTLPLLCYLLYFFKKQPNTYRIVLCYAIFLFVYWYFSRYFNNSHIAYISLLFTVAYFIQPETS